MHIKKQKSLGKLSEGGEMGPEFKFILCILRKEIRKNR